MDHVVSIVHAAMSNLALVSFFGFLLVVVPVLGIMAVHESERPR